MRILCNEGDQPCPYLVCKRKPKCHKYKCGLAYEKRTSKSLGTIWTIEQTEKCVEAQIDYCAMHKKALGNGKCHGAENPAEFIEHFCADCKCYIDKPDQPAQE